MAEPQFAFSVTKLDFSVLLFDKYWTTLKLVQLCIHEQRWQQTDAVAFYISNYSFQSLLKRWRTKFSCAGVVWFTACRLWLQGAWIWDEADYPSPSTHRKSYGSFISVLPGQGTGPSCFPQLYPKGCRQPTKISIHPTPDFLPLPKRTPTTRVSKCHL